MQEMVRERGGERKSAGDWRENAGDGEREREPLTSAILSIKGK